MLNCFNWKDFTGYGILVVFVIGFSKYRNNFYFSRYILNGLSNYKSFEQLKKRVELIKKSLEAKEQESDKLRKVFFKVLTVLWKIIITILMSIIKIFVFVYNFFNKLKIFLKKRIELIEKSLETKEQEIDKPMKVFFEVLTAICNIVLILIVAIIPMIIIKIFIFISTFTNRVNSFGSGVEQSKKSDIKILLIAFLFIFLIDIIMWYIPFFLKAICQIFWNIINYFFIQNFFNTVSLVLLTYFGIKTFNWFQKFNYVLSNLFLEFLFLFCIICILKIIILNISKKEKIILIVCFLVCFFGIILGSNTEINSEVGIRLTKGKLRDLNGKRIRLFFENEKITFQIQNDKNKYYIKYQLPEEEKKYTKDIKETKILFNKDNNLSLFINKEILSKKAKFIVFNNDNSQIIDKDGKIIDNAEIVIKVVKFENKDINNTYIFVNNVYGWWLLNNKDKIYIEEDNIYLNFINLILFLFSVIYFWLKLYGRKNSTYYAKEIIKEIIKEKKEGKINIILDRNKYDKFLTLSMFGLTIPNIWKIVTTKSIGEMNSSIWTKIDIIYIILFSILLFCLITSKEISEYVEELEKENEKEGYIE